MPGYRQWLGFSEGAFQELDNGTILGILRGDSLGQGYKVLSHDGGQTWQGPYATPMIGLEGRPGLGLLSSARWPLPIASVCRTRCWHCIS